MIFKNVPTTKILINSIFQSVKSNWFVDRSFASRNAGGIPDRTFEKNAILYC